MATPCSSDFPLDDYNPEGIVTNTGTSDLC